MPEPESQEQQDKAIEKMAPPCQKVEGTWKEKPPTPDNQLGNGG